VGNRCISSASEQGMAVTSRLRREGADALRKAGEDGESEVASKISRKQLKEHTSTESKGGSNFERNHSHVPSSNGERLSSYDHQISVITRGRSVSRASACHANHSDVCTAT
jgi:hypothetical protein